MQSVTPTPPGLAEPSTPALRGHGFFAAAEVQAPTPGAPPRQEHSRHLENPAGALAAAEAALAAARAAAAEEASLGTAAAADGGGGDPGEGNGGGDGNGGPGG